MNLHQLLLNTSFYFDWPAFNNVYIDGSYITGISQTKNEITFEMDFALLPDHESATSPNAGERYCYRSGRMRFVDTVDPEWIEKCFGIFRKTRRRSGTAIVGYFGRNPDGYTIYGDFGHLRVQCRDVTVELDKPPKSEHSC